MQLYFHNLTCDVGEGHLMYFLVSNTMQLYSILHLQLSLKSIVFCFISKAFVM